jgi:hypothetical protein
VYKYFGAGFNLSCNGNDNWKKCIWKRASKSGAKCEFEYTYLDDKDEWILQKNGCDQSIEIGSDAIDGSKGYRKGDENHVCQLRFISAKLSHEDQWTCTLESCQVPEDAGCKATDGSGICSEATIRVKVMPHSSFIKEITHNINKL